MPAKTQVLRFDRLVHAPPSEVYRAFTNPTAPRDWMCLAAQAEARKGGRIYLWWNDATYATGRYTALAPGRSIAFEWRHSREPEPARIQVTLKPKDGGTAVSLRHWIGTGRKWAGSRKGAEAGWTGALENLQSVLETGVDLRYARRPRMGIFIGEFNLQTAARLRAPTGEGVYVSGAVDGTGAQAAGLQKDDVIVRFGGRKVVNPDSLGPILESRRAGDVVPVVFYRGGEKQTAQLTLSSVSLPETPQTAEALTEAARKVYDEFDAAVAGMIDGVTEAEAERRPAAGEWTVKELLAHYVACERDLQSWIAELVNGGNNAGEAQDSLEYRPNVTVRLAALVGRYPTLLELMEELKRSQAETLAILSALPAEFVTRKYLYYRLGSWMTQVIPGHSDEHRDQFRATIEAARKG